MNRPALKPGTEEIIEHFLAEKLRKIGARGYVLGLSGGIDSAVVLKLASKAVGKDKVLALMMPESDSSEKDLSDATMLCESEGVQNETIDITDVVASFSSVLGTGVRKESLANIKARCRMVVLYYYAAKDKRLVLGTSNKSELLIGYFTKFGDGGADLEPIGDLYKTEVRQMAELLGIPKKIIARTPSAGLWKGQTDEKEIGMSYEKLDAVLMGIELSQDDKTVARNSGVTIDEVKRISKMVKLSSHKRKLPPVVKIGLRTPGLDWRDGDEDI
jgi:NAD+ synthase